MKNLIKNFLLFIGGMILGVCLSFLFYELEKIPAEREKVVFQKEKVLEEIEEKFKRKIEKGLLMFPFFKEKAPEKIPSFSGKIIEIERENKILKVEMPNIYRGGKIADFLYQPDSYLKLVIITAETEIEKKGEKVKFEELKEGESVFVSSKKPFELEKEKIEAKVIRVISY